MGPARNRAAAEAGVEMSSEDPSLEIAPDSVSPAPLPRVVIDTRVEVGVEELRLLLFGDGSELAGRFSRLVGRSSVQTGRWEAAAGSSGRCWERVTQYQAAKTALVKAHWATESQRLLATHDGYVVDVRTSTPDVPYGDSFATLLRYQLTSQGRHSSNLVISWDLSWSGRPPMVSSMVTAGAARGIQSHFDALVELLQ